MTMSKIGRLTPLVMALVAAASQAQSEGDSAFSFSGFATLGLVSTDTDSAQYAIAGATRGAGKSVSGEVDSKVGVQLTAKANKMFSGTVQLLSKQNGNGNFRPEFEWAFAKAQVLPSLAFRLGRMGGPFFAVSDFRDVGYANTWLRPPADVYGQVSFSHFDGADVGYQTSIGSASLTAQLFGGKSTANYTGTEIKYENMMGVNTSLELDGGITLRFGHVQGKLTVGSAALAGLVAVLRTTPFASVGNEMDATNKKATFTGFGAAYDSGNLILNAEYTMRRTESYVSATDGWYGTVGYRVQKFTPYLTVSQVKFKDGNVTNTIPAGVPPLAALKGAVDGLLTSQKLNQKTTALGLRWDAYRNVALKAQFERVKPNGNGMFVQVLPGSGFGTNGMSVNVYSLAVDTVF